MVMVAKAKETGRRVCAWCRRDMGAAPELEAGQATHGICARCKEVLLVEAGCLQVLTMPEVVRHPLGGWTIAEPVDMARSTTRTYRGNWSSKAAAEAALANEVIF